MGSSVMFPDLPELLRQKQLINNLQSKPQVPPAAPVSVAQQVNTPAHQVPGDVKSVQAPSASQMTPPPMGPAASAYQQSLGQPLPQRGDYQPSTGRKIGSVLAGIATGIGNIGRGIRVGEGIYNAPYNQAMQERMQQQGQLKAGSEAEQSGQKTQATLGELLARKNAENARAQQEEAHRRQIEEEIKDPSKRFKPVVPKEPAFYDVTTHDGQKINGAHEDANGSLIGPDGVRIPANIVAESKIQKSGTEKELAPKQIYDKDRGLVVNMGDKPSMTKLEGVTPTPPKETITEKNEEWDRRNKIQFDQSLAKQRNAIQAGISKMDKATAMKADQPGAQTKNTAEFAQTVQKMQPLLDTEIKHLANKIGPGEGRWNQWWVNKGGANDPEFSGLDTDLKLYASALVRVHFQGRSNQVLLGELTKMFSEAQSPEDLKARMQHANKWVEGYANMVKPMGIPDKPTTNNPKDPMGLLGGKQ